MLRIWYFYSCCVLTLNLWLKWINLIDYVILRNYIFINILITLRLLNWCICWFEHFWFILNWYLLFNILIFLILIETLLLLLLILNNLLLIILIIYLLILQVLNILLKKLLLHLINLLLIKLICIWSILRIEAILFFFNFLLIIKINILLI